MAVVRTAGIDLSLTATGIARSDGACARVGLPGVAVASINAQINILNAMAAEIFATAMICNPTAVCIEGLDMSQSYGGQIERTVLWWKVVEMLRSALVTVYVAPSPQVKMYATGKGSGPKGAVIEAVTRRWPQFEHRGDDNLADAAVCALIAAHMLGAPVEMSGHPVIDDTSYLPAAHLRALQSVRSTAAAPPVKARKTGARLTRQVAPGLVTGE